MLTAIDEGQREVAIAEHGMEQWIAQERRTDNALEALRDLSSPRARVVRDGAPVLYSVGVNRIDDGGVPATFGPVRSGSYHVGPVDWAQTVWPKLIQ